MEFTRETYMAAIEHQRKVLQNVGLYVAVQHETYNRRGWSDYMAGVAIKAAHAKVLLHKRAQREGVDVDTGRHLPGVRKALARHGWGSRG